MKEQTYRIKVTCGGKDSCGNVIELPTVGKVRGIVELGLADFANLSVSVDADGVIDGERVEEVKKQLTKDEKSRVERHAEVCGYIKNWANRICSDRLYSDLSVTEEDLKDGKVTFRFSLTPADGKSQEGLGVASDKDARITELEEHLNKLLKFCVYTCNEGTSPITPYYWRTEKDAVECINRSACPELHFEEEVSRDNVEEV